MRLSALGVVGAGPHASYNALSFEVLGSVAGWIQSLYDLDDTNQCLPCPDVILTFQLLQSVVSGEQAVLSTTF